MKRRTMERSLAREEKGPKKEGGRGGKIQDEEKEEVRAQEKTQGFAARIVLDGSIDVFGHMYLRGHIPFAFFLWHSFGILFFDRNH